MSVRVEIFQLAFSPCPRCGSIIRLSVRASGKPGMGKKPPEFPRYCEGCWKILRAERRREARG